MDPTSQDINLNSPNKGLVVDQPESMSELPVEGAVGNSANPLPPGLTEEEAVDLQIELIKVEEEISTLRQVLSAKEKHAAELKRKLGLNPLNELKQNITKGWQDVQASNAYKKTQETLSQASIKTTAAFSTMGTALSRKLGDMRALPFANSFGSNYSIRHSISMPAMRNSTTFKSFEDRVENLKVHTHTHTHTHHICLHTHRLTSSFLTLKFHHILRVRVYMLYPVQYSSSCLSPSRPFYPFSTRWSGPKETEKPAPPTTPTPLRTTHPSEHPHTRPPPPPPHTNTHTSLAAPLNPPRYQRLCCHHLASLVPKNDL
uniref:Tpd52 like 2b n=1 Tax=Gadus morhua TaxID=8049 RepID=A0A8C4ZJJ4_GADMO